MKEECPHWDVECSARFNSKNDFNDFVVYVKSKQYSKHHELKLINHGKKLSKSIYFFNYKEIIPLKKELSMEAYYKTIRAICNFYEEKYLDNEEVLKWLSRVRKIAKKPSCNPDIYTPTDSELQETLDKLKQRSLGVYNYYLALMHSGVRIRDFGRFVSDPTKYRIVKMDGFVKIILNSRNNTKNCYYIYLPEGFESKEFVSLNYLTKFCQENKDIIRPKYIRNWFYSHCLKLGIPSGIIDFYQGRSSVRVGDRHYLDKERMADEKYDFIVKKVS